MLWTIVEQNIFQPHVKAETNYWEWGWGVGRSVSYMYNGVLKLLRLDLGCLEISLLQPQQQRFSIAMCMNNVMLLIQRKIIILHCCSYKWFQFEPFLPGLPPATLIPGSQMCKLLPVLLNTLHVFVNQTFALVNGPSQYIYMCFFIRPMSVIKGLCQYITLYFFITPPVAQDLYIQTEVLC